MRQRASKSCRNFQGNARSVTPTPGQQRQPGVAGHGSRLARAVARVTHQHALQAAQEVIVKQRCRVVHFSGGEPKTQDFSRILRNQMQLETVKPA